MVLKILGSENECDALEKATRTALHDLMLDGMPLERVTDARQVAAHGVRRTPALLADGHELVSGRVPTAAELQALLSAAKV
ncbi:thioredoxin family protein [Nocardioides pakistanensis]